MLGDTAVAVHPDDERYRHLIGKNVILPLIGRRIPIIADEYSDPEKGSGAVKITPAHDFNDFEVGKRHGLSMINVMSPDGKLLLDPNPEFTQNVEPSPELKATILEFNGVFRFAARKMIVHQLEAKGLMEKIEPYVHTVPHGDRSNAVIEPRLTDQWYVDAATLAKPAIEAVEARPHQFRAEELGDHLLPLDGEHPALVHLAPAVVGPSDPGLVRSRRHDLRRRGRGGRARAEPRSITARRLRWSATRTCSTPGSPPRCGRSRRSAGPTRRPSSPATTRPTCWSPASTSSSSGSPA